MTIDDGLEGVFGESSGDPVLASFISGFNSVGAAEGVEIGIGITLLVSGALLSGDLINARAWWEQGVRELADFKTQLEGVPASLLEGVQSTYREMAQGYGEISPSDPVRYVHLKNARFIGRPFQPDDLYLRILIRDVQGWALGKVDNP
jgi:hypothetical protein